MPNHWLHYITKYKMLKIFYSSFFIKSSFFLILSIINWMFAANKKVKQIVFICFSQKISLKKIISFVLDINIRKNNENQYIIN